MITVDNIIGCLLGTAVGDGMGLPSEGLSYRRQRLLFPQIKGPHLLGEWGMISDDTEQTCMVAEALILSGGNAANFQQQLAYKLKIWLLTLPGGVGLATLGGISKLWLGYSPDESGIFSAGNGAAMRSAILGVCYGNDLVKLRKFVTISTQITHRDPQANYAALAVALAAFFSAQTQGKINGEDYQQVLQELLAGEAPDFLSLIKAALLSASKNESSEIFAQKIGAKDGISGYSYQTVPVVIQTWLRTPENYKEGILEIIRCGGDTDTTAAILGAIIGARVGKNGIPKSWLDHLFLWPITVNRMEHLGQLLARTRETDLPQSLKSPFLGSLFLRNLVFLVIVLFHGFRRLFPPF